MFLQFIHKDVKSCQNVIFLFMLIYQFTNESLDKNLPQRNAFLLL